ncbi:MAG TPA: hypothetical protein VEB43_13085 [Anaeromyxobacter sp.]|nr:hypothetical protein [Anaeromyxobacter sp.]
MRATRPFAALAAAVLVLACGGGGSDGLGVQEPPPPETTCPIPVAVASPTFREHILPVLRQTCGANSAISCHGTPSPRGHVSYAASLTASEIHAQLLAEPANAPLDAGWRRIAPGDPARSWLLEKVTKDDPGGAGQAYGNRMPLGLPNLCAPTVETIRSWVAAGAKDD